ncbi:hypothetical protein [Paenibacillus baimaensis]|nr:hypothetical protein [Paenibacillus sp. WQ 127069]
MDHSFSDIRMSEYKKDWHGYTVFQIFFVMVFVFLLNYIDLQAIYGIVAFDMLNSSVKSVDWLQNYFLYGSVQVIYICSVTIAMNIFMFFTVRPSPIWSRFLGIILDRNLSAFILSFFLFYFSMWALNKIDVMPIWKLIVTIATLLASGGALARYVWMCSRWLKLASAVVTIGAVIFSWYSYEATKGQHIVFRIFYVMINVFAANVYLLLFVLICFFLVIIVLLELRSAQEGKVFLHRRLLLSNFLNSAEAADHSLERLKKWKYSEELLKHAIHTVYRINAPSMDYFTKLKLIQSLTRIDLSLIYPVYLSQYIRFRNKTNLMLSFLFAANALAVVLFVLPYTSRKREAIVILLIILFSRLLSRTVEVGYAFSRDVLSSQPKGSALTGADRVRLAVTSIVEMAVTSSVVYFLYGHLKKLGDVVKPFENGYALYALDAFGDYLQALFGGVAIAVFNISYPMTEEFAFTMLVHLIQVLNSVILITLSIANYLNMKKDVHLYVAERTQDRLIIWYASLQDEGEVIKREVADGKDEEEVKHFLLEKWRAKEIGDQDYKEILVCIKEKPSRNDGLDRVSKMTFEQLDRYVIETLREIRGKDNRPSMWNWIRNK